MLLTLNVAALRGRLDLPGGGGGGGGSGPGGSKLKITDVPILAKQELGVNGLVISTDLLVGADRQSLQKLLEAADKAGCPCLVLMETLPQHLCSDDPVKAAAVADRCLRVAQAAHWLGCSAFSIPVQAKDNDDDLMETAAALKPISRRAEKLDLNLCIAPRAGLTATPERVTELLKKIGGFRVGTLPDFAGAAESPDPVQYLRRLVPYGSAVLVPAVEGEAAAMAEAGDPSDRKKSSAKPVKAPKAPAKSKSKKKKAEDAEAELAAVEQLTAASAAPAAKMGYDLLTFAQVLEAVGYEGPVALDYRGTGDAMAALQRTRDILLKVLAAPAEAEDAGLSALLAAVEGGGAGDELEEDPADTEEETPAVEE